ncbi:MAG: abortive infection family protein [Saprospiraceae bacterium]|nr:abortive infection family protein [Saprospiraceae bacterium]
MKISENTIEHLKLVVTGDSGFTPYLSGPKLVKLFNRYGFNFIYEAGFPSRHIFAEDRLRDMNNSTELKSLIEEILDVRKFIGKEDVLDSAVKHVNSFLKFDGYKFKKKGEFFKIYDDTGNLIEAKTIETLSHEFVNEQVEKCNDKITTGDYNGAITNARSLTEAVFIDLIEDLTRKEVKYKGDLTQLYKSVKKELKLNVDKEQMPESIIQILSGLNSIVNGLAGVSNSYGDRHATKKKPSKHHAKLAVNCAISICDFVIDSKEYQTRKEE